MQNDPWIQRIVVVGLVSICVVSLLTAAQMKAGSGDTPAWLVAIASMATGSLATLATPGLGKNGNGKGSGNSL